MKKTNIILTIALLFVYGFQTSAQIKGNFEAFNAEKDELGITGQYFGKVDKRSFAFRFVKEADGKIVNQLHYFEKKKSVEPQMKLSMKESYFSKNNVKLFYFWTGSCQATGRPNRRRSPRGRPGFGARDRSQGQGQCPGHHHQRQCPDRG